MKSLVREQITCISVLACTASFVNKKPSCSSGVLISPAAEGERAQPGKLPSWYLKNVTYILGRGRTTASPTLRPLRLCEVALQP